MFIVQEDLLEKECIIVIQRLNLCDLVQGSLVRGVMRTKHGAHEQSSTHEKLQERPATTPNLVPSPFNYRRMTCYPVSH